MRHRSEEAHKRIIMRLFRLILVSLRETLINQY
jgi:hypothetical protein